MDGKTHTTVPGNRRIIDRTLPELVASGNGKNDIGRTELHDMIGLIHTLGADMLEIDHSVLKKAGKLPAGMSFLYRIDSVCALEGLFLNSFRDIVVNMDVSHFDSILRELISQKMNITVEYRAETEYDLLFIRKQLDTHWMRGAATLRITGLNRFIQASWLDTVADIKRIAGVNVDICPENRFYNATAVAVDGLMDMTDDITATFMGYGGGSGYAALEQLLAFAAVMLGWRERIRLNILPELAALFSRATGVQIPENMPVIGKNIFRYESGIHADGIDKNPMTYEPFDPGLVGLERKLSVGKHSGGRSIEKKLRELGIAVEKNQISDFLRRIREKSISLRRSLDDQEILDLLKYPV